MTLSSTLRRSPKAATVNAKPVPPRPAAAPTVAAPPAPTRIFDLIAHQLAHFPKPDALAHKIAGKWKKFSTRQIVETARALAAGLHAAGVRPGDRIANLTETNRAEWNIIDLAVLQLGAVHVPIYPTLTPEECRFILDDAGAKLVFVSSEALHAKISGIAGQLPALENIYLYRRPARTAGSAITPARVWTELRDQGARLLLGDPAFAREIDALAAAVRPETLATLIYTSGTTGQPKGVMLSHANLVSNCLAIVPLIGGSPAERAISFLPLCHIFERTLTNAYLYLGMSVYYAESLERIGDNMREVHPNFFAIVPRILEKIYERIIARGSALTGQRRKLFFWALDLAERIDPEKPETTTLSDRMQLALADKLVFSKWRAALGGRVNSIVCGSAALNPKLARVFWNAGVRVYEGYGPTEAAPVVTTNHSSAGHHRIGTVGPVVAGGEIRLAPDGEILYRGPNVMLGYYHRPDLTAEAVDAEGFLHTGDVGEFVEGLDGLKFLRITDRKKEIFKTSGGKYIAPQPVENHLKESPLIAQAMVVGEYRKFPGALIVPNFELVRERLASAVSEAGEPLPVSDVELAGLPTVRRLIGEEIAKINATLAQYAQIKNFQVLGAEWTAAGGELTPTQKLKRREIVKKFAAEIESIYAEAGR